MRGRRGERRQKCVHCGMPGALLLFQVIRCPNPSCQFYDRHLEPPEPDEDWRGLSAGRYPGS